MWLNILSYTSVLVTQLITLVFAVLLIMTATFPIMFLLACITPRYYLYIEAVIVVFILWYNRDYKD